MKRMVSSWNKQIEALQVTKSHLTIISCGLRVSGLDFVESCDTQCNQNLTVSVTLDEPEEGIIKTTDHEGYTWEEKEEEKEEEKISQSRCSLMFTYSWVFLFFLSLSLPHSELELACSAFLYQSNIVSPAINDEKKVRDALTWK